ncbi:type II toxin-antitoxin system VapC family toxin [Pseudonocardia nigra]|uniref:type II toxin-antitoxin system VapC family toxin n=1 Tax=Pseudonocardia nigra TaxID=1921578 RepID=UPI001C6027DE|nr:type II toxin-antitoxin system VapC family toxin [Pseudonocardia nigra]
MIYLDSCVLVKLIRAEAESEALQAWLDERPDELLVTSELAHAEVLRVVRRNNHTDQGALIDAAQLTTDLAEAAFVLDGLQHITVDRELLERAGAVEAPMLRTLDAIHLVSALELAKLDPEVVTYDRRLAEIARTAGLRAVAPGT